MGESDKTGIGSIKNSENKEKIHYSHSTRFEQVEAIYTPPSTEFKQSINHERLRTNNPRLSELDSPLYDDSEWYVQYIYGGGDQSLKLSTSDELFLKGMLAYSKNNLNQAIQLLSKSYLINNQFTPSAYFIYVIHDLKRDEEQVNHWIRVINKNDPNFPPGLFLKGAQYESQNNKNSAKELYKFASTMAPELLLPKLFYADIVAETNCESALKLYEEILQVSPTMRGAMLGKAKCLEKNGAKLLAYNEYIHSFSVPESYSEIYIYHSKNKSNLGLISIPLWNSWVKLPFLTSLYYSDRSKLYFESSDYKNALDDITKAIQAGGTSLFPGDYFSQRSKIYVALKNYKKALEDINMALKLVGPKLKIMHLGNREKIYEKLGMNEKAEEDRKQINKELGLNKIVCKLAKKEINNSKITNKERESFKNILTDCN